MMSQGVFKNCILGLCKMNGVQVDDETLRMYYAKVRNDFTDDEFRAIANDILETEILYGKFPAPALFYNRKKQEKKKNDDSAYLTARQSFQDKLMELVYNDYNTKELIDEFNQSLTASESAALAALGGLSAVRASCRDKGLWSDEKEDWAIRRIQEKFKENYNADADSRLQITEVRNEEMVQKLEDLTKGMFK